MNIKEESKKDVFGNEEFRTFGSKGAYQDLRIEELEELAKNMISCKNLDLNIRIKEIETEIKLRKRYYNQKNF